MKKLILFAAAAIMALALAACRNNAEYRVTIAEDYPIENELEESYAPGEEVSIKLQTITEHYYELYVNGEKQQMADSDMYYTYFTFTMPAGDATVEIRDRWVDIPET